MHFEEQYRQLIYKIINDGYRSFPSKGDCREVPTANIILSPDTLPLITGRRMYPRGIIGELKAFLNNATGKDFSKYGCNFWGAWADAPIDYARLLHDFNGVNQLEKVLTSLVNKPSSRKHIISLWDPSSTTLQPPCVMHYQWLVDEQGKLNMIWSQRSVDVMVGLASDMFSAWLFNLLMSEATGYEQGTVYMQLGACHIYSIHNPQDYLKNEYSLKPLDYKLDFRSIKDWEFEILDYPDTPKVRYELCV